MAEYNYVAWGQGLVEYQAMFDLSDADIKANKILEYSWGPTAFLAEAKAMNPQVQSCSPCFSKTADELTAWIQAHQDRSKDYMHKHPEEYVWQFYNSEAEFLARRQQCVQAFLQDYQNDPKQYQAVDISNLRFAENSFDIAVISHELFFHHENYSYNEVIHAIESLCRIATEVRLFPLITYTGAVSDQVGPVMSDLQAHNFGVEIRQVSYELEQGANAMMRVWARECEV